MLRPATSKEKSQERTIFAEESTDKGRLPRLRSFVLVTAAAAAGFLLGRRFSGGRTPPESEIEIDDTGSGDVLEQPVEPNVAADESDFGGDAGSHADDVAAENYGEDAPETVEDEESPHQSEEEVDVDDETETADTSEEAEETEE